MNKKLTMIIVLLTITFSACTGALGQDELEGTEWRLISYDNTPVLPGSNPTLSFGQGDLGGNASCNMFGGAYQIKGGKIIITELYSTLMACMDEGVMDQEQAYLRLLGGESRYEIIDGKLHIRSEEGKTLIFDPTN